VTREGADEHIKDAAEDAAHDVAEGAPKDVAQDQAFGARAARAILLLATPPAPLSWQNIY